MYNYLYDDLEHTDISTQYLKTLGMDDEGILALQRDAKDYDIRKYDEMIRQRDQMLDENDWTIMRHKDEVDLGMTPTLSPPAYQNTLIWRQQLRDMPESLKAGYKAGEATPKWTWPTIPPELEDDFPDYPPE